MGHRSPRLLVRRVTATAGTVDVALELVPRPEYGLVTPVIVPVDGGVRFHGGPDVMMLSTPVPVTVVDGRCDGAIRLGRR